MPNGKVKRVLGNLLRTKEEDKRENTTVKGQSRRRQSSVKPCEAYLVKRSTEYTQGLISMLTLHVKILSKPGWPNLVRNKI